MFAKIENGIPRELTEQKIIGPKGEQASRQILDLWASEQLAAWNISEVEIEPVPDGQIVVSEQLMLVGEVVRLVRVTEPAPVFQPPNPVDVVGDYELKIILSLQNEIRELKGKPALADIAALKVELKKTVTVDVAAVEAAAAVLP